MQQQCNKCAETVEQKQNEFAVVPWKNDDKIISPKTTFALDKTKIQSPTDVLVNMNKYTKSDLKCLFLSFHVNK